MCKWEIIIYAKIPNCLLEMILIGASLSEPHTSVTALQDACVCLSVCVWPYTENFN